MSALSERLHVLAREYHQHRPHYEEAAAEIDRLMAENDDFDKWITWQRKELGLLRAEVARLREIGNAAFMAMCAFRDNNDDEAFQDAIDALGSALKDTTP